LKGGAMAGFLYVFVFIFAIILLFNAGVLHFIMIGIIPLILVRLTFNIPNAILKWLAFWAVFLLIALPVDAWVIAHILTQIAKALLNALD